MTINEFKAWLEGFSSSIYHSPTKEQWEKVLEKVRSVSHTNLSAYKIPTYFPYSYDGEVSFNKVESPTVKNVPPTPYADPDQTAFFTTQTDGENVNWYSVKGV